MHNYQDVHTVLPPGIIAASNCPRGIFVGCQNTPWFVLMLPQFEQQNLANSFNYALGTEGPLAPVPLPGFFANSTVPATKLSLFQCPSDRENSYQVNPTIAGGYLSGPIETKGNYGVSWGNTYWGQDMPSPSGILTDPVTGRPVNFLPSRSASTAISVSTRSPTG